MLYFNKYDVCIQSSLIYGGSYKNYTCYYYYSKEFRDFIRISAGDYIDCAHDFPTTYGSEKAIRSDIKCILNLKEKNLYEKKLADLYEKEELYFKEFLSTSPISKTLDCNYIKLR